MPILYLDLETRSSTNLKKSGVYRYVEDEDFAVILTAYAIDDGPVIVTTYADDTRDMVLDPDYLKVAHNAQFDRVALSAAYGVKGYLDPAQWRDSMAVAAQHGYPRQLKALAKALEVEDKDEAGTRLINLFSKPRRDGDFNASADKPEQWAEFVEYARQDVSTLREVCEALPDERADERAVWVADQRINDRGVKIDTDFARAALRADERNREALKRHMSEVTGVGNPNSTAQLIEWLQSTGLDIGNLRAATVAKTLERGSLTPDQRAVLEGRQGLALSASRKYQAALNAVCADGRVRGTTAYYGAHTGRWAGRLIQLQNLPRASIDKPGKAIKRVKRTERAEPEELKALLRPMLPGPLTVVDYSAIEARVLAWLAGEKWVLEAFGEGRDIYVETAARLGPQFTRQDGKTSALACGYGGAVGAIQRFAPDMDTQDALATVRAWRKANRRIVKFWYDLEEAFRHGGRVRRVEVEWDMSKRTIWLPSGRPLTYHGVNSKAQTYRDPKGFKARWYGGYLAENVTQAIARDLLAGALVSLDEDGVPVVSHVHDEVVAEGDHYDAVSAAMLAAPPWAKGLPLEVDGSVMKRYGKG